ncbi:MAG: HPP family protein [Actinomycetota bacterium]|nr:HPP family protein [Actinomycetota bacterium]
MALPDLRERLIDRFGRAGLALYALAAGAFGLAACGVAAAALRQPLLFPSLGPTVFLAFETPLQVEASPRNAVIGHLVGLTAGALSLALFGLPAEASALHTGVSAARIAASVLALSLTGTVLLLVHAHHPPAGATTLIVSLGLVSVADGYLAIGSGVVLLMAVAWVVNRACGVPFPLWSPRRAETLPE